MNLNLCRKMRIPLQNLTLLMILIAIERSLSDSSHNYEPAHKYPSSDYNFSYGVKDPHTGDVKHQWEKKEGDVVRGQYSVLEPDGSTRTVDYTADGQHGFHAVVKHDGISHHPPMPKPPAATRGKLTAAAPGPAQGAVVQMHFDPPTPSEGHEVPHDTQFSLNSLYSIGGKPTGEGQGAMGLPVDLSVIDPDLVPVDVALLEPINVHLDDLQAPQPGAAAHVPDAGASLGGFLRDFYQTGVDKFNEPHMETGFQPMTPPPAHNEIHQPPTSVPQTFKSNKKPFMTPGLKNYATSNPEPRHKGFLTYAQSPKRPPNSYGRFYRSYPHSMRFTRNNNFF